MSNPGEKSSRILFWIAVYKLLLGLLLLLVATRALFFVSESYALRMARWTTLMQADPHNYYFHYLMGKLTPLSVADLRQVSAGSFFFGAVLILESIGLFLRKRWGEYMALFATGSLLPIEVLHIFHRADPVKILTFAINLLVVLYLARLLRHSK